MCAVLKFQPYPGEKSVSTPHPPVTQYLILLKFYKIYILQVFSAKLHIVNLYVADFKIVALRVWYHFAEDLHAIDCTCYHHVLIAKLSYHGTLSRGGGT